MIAVRRVPPGQRKMLSKWRARTTIKKLPSITGIILLLVLVLLILIECSSP
jgi:hypothetical protein